MHIARQFEMYGGCGGGGSLVVATRHQSSTRRHTATTESVLVMTVVISSLLSAPEPAAATARSPPCRSDSCGARAPSSAWPQGHPLERTQRVAGYTGSAVLHMAVDRTFNEVGGLFFSS